MTLADAVRVLVLGAGRQFPVLSVAGQRVLFSDDDDAAFRKGLRRLVDVGLLERVACGVYLNMALPGMGLKGVGVVARHLRPRHLCYLSYESALSDYGSIDQVPMVYIIATTGNPGAYSTRYGDIEFSHTTRGEVEILRNTEFDDRLGMRVASPALAEDDLRRIRPGNLHLIDAESHEDALAEWADRHRAAQGGGQA